MCVSFHQNKKIFIQILYNIVAKMDLLQPFLKRVIKRTPKSNPKTQQFELRKKSSSPAGLNKVKKRVRFELNENHHNNKLDDQILSQNGTQIKILMTKEEAARFLSRCKDGGIVDAINSSTPNKE